MIWSSKLTALTAAVVLAGGALGATALDKTVSLSVDGQTTSATGFAGTVGDLLKSQGIEVGPRDVVIPSLDSPLTDGGSVQVQFARKVTLTCQACKVSQLRLKLLSRSIIGDATATRLRGWEARGSE